MAESLEQTHETTTTAGKNTVDRTNHSTEHNVPIFQLDPEKPFEIETFCKDIPISVLSKGIRFDLTSIPKENHPSFFNVIKNTYPNHSWVSLAADRSYIDISFKEDSDSTSALETPLEFQGQLLYPISILSYKNQLYFIIFKDLPAHLDPVSTKDLILKKVKVLGSLVKLSFFEIENTGFLAPLAAGVVQLFDGVASNGHPQEPTSDQGELSVVFKGLIEYCAACQCLGHPHCNFSPPDPSDSNQFVPPSNGHGAGDIMPFPLSGVNTGPPNVPLDLLTNNMVQMPGPQKLVSSQFISFKDIMRNADMPDNPVVDGLFKSNFGNFGFGNNFGASTDFSRDALGAYLNGSLNSSQAPTQSQAALAQTGANRPGFQTSLNVALYGPSSSAKKPKTTRVPPPRGPNDLPKKRGRPRKVNLDGKPAGVMVGPQGRIDLQAAATDTMMPTEGIPEAFSVPFSNGHNSNSNGTGQTTPGNPLPKKRGRPRKNFDAPATTNVSNAPTSATSLSSTNLLAHSQATQLESSQPLAASLPYQQLSSAEFAGIQTDATNQAFQSLTDLQNGDFSAASLGVSGVSYMPQYFQNLSVAPNSTYSVSELTTPGLHRDPTLGSEAPSETTGFHDHLPTFSQ